MSKFLDMSGLDYLWGRIKSVFVAKVEGKDLSSNDYTSAEKTKLAGIAVGANKYTLPTAARDQLGGVKTTSTVTATTGLTPVPIIAGVPYYKDTNTTGNIAGDVYNAKDSGMNYVWTGTEWDALGAVFTIDAITNAEIDTVCV